MNRQILFTCLSLASIVLTGMPNVATAATDTGNFTQDIAAGAPPALSHWKKLIGRWQTTEEGLAPDGATWQPSKPASWEFMWAFNGWGIQDDYVSPPLSVPLDDETARQRGTNLRIYNVKEDKWVMTWLTTASTKAATFTAASTNDEIVMRADDLTPTGFHSRITFFEMTDTSFKWKLEYSKDQESWFEVYRIFGTRESAAQ